MNIWCDLDGVLVDFINTACTLHGRQNPYDDPKAKGDWDVVTLLGMTDDAFWKPIDATFWETLPWMPDGRQILETLFGVTQHIWLASKPQPNAECYYGKAKWVERELPMMFHQGRLMLGHAKERLSKEFATLVDDCDTNVEEWIMGGGSAILVPRPWNANWRLGGDVIGYLTDCLARIQHAEWERETNGLAYSEDD